jgi:hypothetical protein
VDRVKVERYAASVAISKVGVGVELLNDPDAAQWCRRQLQPLAGTIANPEQWLEFIDLGFRALAVCIRANDTETARGIMRRHTLRLNRLLSRPLAAGVTWNGHRVARVKTRRELSRWFETRRLEEICASIRLSDLASNSKTTSLLKRLLPSPLRVGRRSFGASAVSNRALLLFRSDLRTVDRETDLRGSAYRSIRRRAGIQIESARDFLRRGERTAERLVWIEQFLRACEEMRDPTYTGASVVDVLTMTRPPTAFDIARRWSKAARVASDLVNVINAVRGTHYDSEVVRSEGPNSIDISSPFHFDNVGDVLVVLGNLPTETAWWEAAAKGRPIVTKERMRAIGDIVNEAIKLRYRTKKSTLLVLPELSLPADLLRALTDRLMAEGVNLIAGLEYSASTAGVVNEAIGVFTPGFRATAVCWWRKTLPARPEAKELARLKIKFVEHQPVDLVMTTDFGAISTLICSELLDVRSRAALRGRIDLLIVPSWNQDTATFDHTVQTTANDLHAFVAVANNSLYSDCRIQVPSDERHLRDACRLICRTQAMTIASTVSASALRDFQLASIKNPLGKRKGFKPLPPGYEFKR